MLPAERSEVEIPVLPFAETANSFTLVWWKTVWESPMGAMYKDADTLVLVRMAQLVDQVAQGSASREVLSELRQLEDRFGLSPLARRRIGWEFEDKVEKQARKADNVTDMKKWRQRLG